MNPDFPLASWEVPPASQIPLVAPADAVFDAIWRGRETQIWVRRIETCNGPRTYFRDGASDETGNWLGSQMNSHHIPAEEREEFWSDFTFHSTYWEPLV